MLTARCLTLYVCLQTSAPAAAMEPPLSLEPLQHQALAQSQRSEEIPHLRPPKVCFNDCAVSQQCLLWSRHASTSSYTDIQSKAVHDLT